MPAPCPPSLGLVSLALLACVGATFGFSLPLGPTIGVLGEPMDQCTSDLTKAQLAQLPKNVTSCFSNVYTPWLMSHGARTVPIRYDATQAELDDVFQSVNGILFTGGDVILSPSGPPQDAQYYKTASLLLDMVLSVPDRNVPLWGTCMGFQLLNQLVAGVDVLDHNVYDSIGLSLPLNFTAAAPGSRMYGQMRTELFDNLKLPITDNLHHDGVPPARFLANSNLTSFFNMLSTNVDREGRPFVSSMEAKEHPVYGVQYHPERAAWEYNTFINASHSLAATDTMSWLSRFFVAQARNNSHAFPSPESEQAALIWSVATQVNRGSSGYAYYFF